GRLLQVGLFSIVDPHPENRMRSTTLSARHSRRRSVLSQCAKAVLESLEQRIQFATITVTGIGDDVAVDGQVTLREAINSLNAGAPVNADVAATGLPYGDQDEIHFNIAGPGVHQILPQSQLTINDPMTIDGFTQPFAHPNSAPVVDSSLHLIEL